MKLLIAIIIFLILVALATYLIGSYFVRYALVPNMGAEDRVLDTDDNMPTEDQVCDERLRDAWVEEMNLDTKEVHIESHDGLQLVGHAFEQEQPTNDWVIALHGYQSDEEETLLIGRHFFEAGYNVLTISLRAHGKSEGDYIGMGYLDKEDLLSWTDFLIDKDPRSQIIYHGTSMGGATALMASGLALSQNVKAIVSDCAFSNIWDIFAAELKNRYNLPTFPILHMAQIMGVVHAGYNIKDGNVLEYVAKSTVPIFFLHTKPDDFVPVEMVSDLFEAKKAGVKELLVFKDGGHAEAKFMDPEMYYQRIFQFIEQYL